MRTLLCLASTLVATTAALATAPADANTDPVPVRDHNVTVVMSTAGTTGNRDTEHPVLGPARESRLSSNSSTSPTFDSEGNLYLADPGYSQIVKLAPTASGTYDVVARLGSPGFRATTEPYPDGTPLSEVAFYSIGPVAFAPDGRMYVSDELNSIVYRVEDDGTVTRVFGTGSNDPVPATPPSDPLDMTVRSLYTIATDAAGSLYLLSDETLYKITSPGTAEAELTSILSGTAGAPIPSAPTPVGDAVVAPLRDVAVRGDGALYLSTGDYVVRLSDGVVSPVAGGGSMRAGFDPIPALSAGFGVFVNIAVSPDGVLYSSGNGEGILETVPTPEPSIRVIAGVGRNDELLVDGPGRTAKGFFFDLALNPATGEVVFMSDSRFFFGTRPRLTTFTQLGSVATLEKPDAVTAVGGVGEATVTLTPPTFGNLPTSYTVTSIPDAKTCTVDPSVSLSCTVTGLDATKTYLFAAVSEIGAATSPSTQSDVPIVIEPPVVPVDADTDGDGLSDDREAELGTDPTRADTDGDGFSDGAEVKGVVADLRVFRGRLDGGKPVRVMRVFTSPTRRDTDGDGIGDQAELRGIVLRQVVITKTGRYTIGKVRMNPTKADTDGDGLTDKEEVTGSRNRRFASATSDPSRADTDKGGIRDGSEVRQGTNPVSS